MTRPDITCPACGSLDFGHACPGPRNTCTVASHAAAVRDDAQWSLFRRVAVWFLGGEKHDTRNCPHCDSSLSRVIERPASQRLQWIPVISLDEARQVFSAVEAEMVVAL